LFWVFTLTLLPQWAFASLTIESVGGAYSSSSITSGTATVYAGRAEDSTNGNTCTASSTAETCNNCLVMGYVCNPKFVPISSYLTLTILSDETGSITVKNSSSATVTHTGATTATDGQSFTIYLYWTDICSGIGVTAACNTTGNGDLTIGVNSAASTATLTAYVRTVATTATDADNTCATSSQGLCNFSLFPGDEKIYAGFDASSGFPTSTDTTSIVSARLFYVASPIYDDCTVATVSTLFSHGESRDVSINTDSFDETIYGFNNDVTYCFRMANIDQANNILRYTPVAVDTDIKKVIPSEVVGLLTAEQNCFIATAAYGSSFDSHVETLRKFRDAFLIPTQLGRRFVKWYYNMSPPWAAKLRQHEVVRSIVRMLLWPLWLVAHLLLTFGPWLVLLLFMSTFSGLYFVKKKFFARTAILFLVFCYLLAPSKSWAQEEDGLDLSEMPPQEAPFVAPEKEQALQEVPMTSRPPLPKDSQEKVEEIHQSITQDTQAIHQENERIEKLRNEVDELERKQRIRRINIRSKQDAVYDIEKKEFKKKQIEQSKESPIKAFQQSNVIQYPRNVTPKKYGAAFRVAKYSPIALRNSETGLSFQDVYTESNDLMIMLEGEWQFFQSFGTSALKIGSGFFTAQGDGRFKKDNTVAREKYTFMMFPNSLGAVYRAQYWEKQPIVPYVEGGAGYFTFVELRDDGKRTKYGGSGVLYFAGGVNLPLDWLNPSTMAELDADLGVNHMWLTAEWRSYQGLRSDLDFSSDAYNLGFFLEF